MIVQTAFFVLSGWLPVVEVVLIFVMYFKVEDHSEHLDEGSWEAGLPGSSHESI